VVPDTPAGFTMKAAVSAENPNGITPLNQIFIRVETIYFDLYWSLVVQDTKPCLKSGKLVHCFSNLFVTKQFLVHNSDSFFALNTLQALPSRRTLTAETT
jgi:hypothetical protein